jgi:hypothetical protein
MMLRKYSCQKSRAKTAKAGDGSTFLVRSVSEYLKGSDPKFAAAVAYANVVVVHEGFWITISMSSC